MSDLTRLTLADARAGLKKKEFSSTELTTAFVKAIDAGNTALNAYVLPTPEIALKKTIGDHPLTIINGGVPAPLALTAADNAAGALTVKIARFSSRSPLAMNVRTPPKS